MTVEKIKVNTHGNKMPEAIENGDWIDLRSAETVTLDAGEYRMISLGISMKLPDGYEAHVLPRSSTFKKWGILLVNGMGIIDNSYCGSNDIWQFPALAMRKTTIHEGDRICQFRIVKKQPDIQFIEDWLEDNKNRGGFGSTGHN
jgi:dUTP pyrophosphatase